MRFTINADSESDAHAKAVSELRDKYPDAQIVAVAAPSIFRKEPQ